MRSIRSIMKRRRRRMKDQHQHGETMKIVLLPAADAPYDEDGKK
jgi:hypothetical protein